MATIDSWLGEVTKGGGRLVWIEGEAGVGKTALVGAARAAEFRAQHEQD